MNKTYVGKFTSITQYGKHLFSVRESSDNFESLKIIENKVKDDDKFNFKPIYLKTIKDKEYITLMVNGLKYKLNEKDRGNEYSFKLDFRIGKSARGLEYLNIYVKNMVLVKTNNDKPVGDVYSLHDVLV